MGPGLTRRLQSVFSGKYFWSLQVYTIFSNKLLPRCEQCGCPTFDQYTRVTKQPPILILHLLRFSNALQKISHTVSFGANLRLNPESPLYILTCVLLHIGGTLTSGHYASIVRCCMTGTYYYLSDDATPWEVPLAQLPALIKDAYMLVYSQKAATLDISRHPVLPDRPGGEPAATPSAKRPQTFTPRQKLKLQKSEVSGREQQDSDHH